MAADFDVVIAGGGLAGAGAAALLATTTGTAALRIAVLEPAVPPPPGADLDLRVALLSRASQVLLERTGAWPAVTARGAAACQRMVVWEEKGTAQGPGSLCFAADQCGEPDLGHVVENRTVQRALLERAGAAGVAILPVAVAALTSAPGALALTTSDGGRLTARLLVGADGGGSTVRRLAGIGVRGRDYDQQAVVAHLRPAQPHRDTAWQRFLASGPLALLPLADGRVSLVWSTTPEQANGLLAATAAGFSAQVTTATAGVLGELELASARAAFPLRRQRASRHVAARVALVGDAAQVVHPLAGQGVNLGFLDAGALAEVLAAALAAGADPGEARVLGRYERWRRAASGPLIAALDGLQRLFAGADPARSWLRRRGLGLVEATPAAKRRLIRHALGGDGAAPRLLQPRRGG